ncbi:MAG: aspartate--tRNA ligase [Nanoarchaeota archaeon]|nr:aspartate--tRNA ligase [Nanoarchaeota archaeon]
MLRTHTCSELSKKHLNKKVILCGWVDSIRSHGKVSFIDLRDRYGITQLFYPKKLDIKKETVIQVEGKVKEKPNPNKKLKTGSIEIDVEKLNVLSKSQSLPLEIENPDNTEETRLKYRYLDLRTKRMQHNLILRHKIFKAIRDYLDNENFLEIETPVLAKSTPEGARDYVVPSRVYKSKFFALPQSPQLFKQLLMISNFDKYFQIVKCYRDEDLRADRQPEFTQLDIEMSFIEEKDVYDLCEGLLKYVFKKALNKDIKIPFQRLPYEQAIKEYKTDKPDLRKNEEFKFVWIVDFPMFEYSKEEKRYKSMHHPFTLPKEDDFRNIDKLKARAYDLVLNGSEIAGGSLRIFDKELQMKVFKALKIDEKEAKDKFGFLLEAMDYGCPPLGGIAFGLDRLMAIICNEVSIRDVIAFPKNKDAKDLMLDSPSNISKEQLKELGL